MCNSSKTYFLKTLFSNKIIKTMKTIKTIIYTAAIAIAFSACNNSEKSKTITTGSTTSTVNQSENQVNIDEAMVGMPEFSSPEIQKAAQEWFSAFGAGLKEAQQKAVIANGDESKIKEIANEMATKFEPWKPKLEKLQADMTAEDKRLFDEYGNKISNSIIAQSKQN